MTNNQTVILNSETKMPSLKSEYDKFEITPTGLIWKEKPTDELMLLAAGHLSALGNSVQWGWADWLLDAIRVNGGQPGKIYRIGCGIVGRESKTLENWANTAKHWEPKRRRWGKGAMYSHHVVLNSCTSEQQERLLDISQERGLSTRQLEKLRDEKYPQYKRQTKYIGPIDPSEELARLQAKTEALEQDLWQANQDLTVVQSQLNERNGVLAEAGMLGDLLRAGMETIGFPATVQRLVDGGLLTTEEVDEVLAEVPGQSARLFVSGNRLGIADKNGGLSWPDDPVSEWLLWHYRNR